MKFGEAAIFVAGAIVTYGIATKIVGIASAVQGLGLALMANPWAMLLTGIVAAGAVIYYEYNKMHEGLDRNTTTCAERRSKRMCSVGSSSPTT